MYKMTKKSLAGRLLFLPVFVPVLLLEAFLNKADDWSYPVSRLRRKMEAWVDKVFPLGRPQNTKEDV